MAQLRTHRWAVLCIGLLCALTLTAHAEETPPLAVIVSNKPELAVVQQLAARELGQIFWRKKQYWQTGVRIHPVNLHAEHPLRIAFSKTVLGSPPGEQADYWNGLYFHGTKPPYSLQSEEAVLRYVSTTKGAVGYISICELDDRVKPLLWIEQNSISASKPDYDCQP